jgi:hypothetical protein
MAGKGSSFTKRQKERSRQEKQREKAERRNQRKAEKSSGEPGGLTDSIEHLVDSPADPFARNLGEDALLDTDQDQ